MARNNISRRHRVFMPAALLCGAALLGGCVQQLGGAGELQNGAPVIGEVQVNYETGINTLIVRSPEGWSCSGSYQRTAVTGVNVTMPMTCNDGRTGNGILSVTQQPNEVTLAFAISGGRQGAVRFFVPA